MSLRVSSAAGLNYILEELFYLSLWSMALLRLVIWRSSSTMVPLPPHNPFRARCKTECAAAAIADTDDLVTTCPWCCGHEWCQFCGPWSHPPLLGTMSLRVSSAAGLNYILEELFYLSLWSMALLRLVIWRSSSTMVPLPPHNPFRARCKTECAAAAIADTDDLVTTYICVLMILIDAGMWNTSLSINNDTIG